MVSVSKIKKKNKVDIFKTISFVVLFLYVTSMFLILLWALLTSLKTPDEYYDNIIGFPKSFAISNYIDVFKSFIAISEGPNSLQESVYIEGMLLNTIMYAGVGGFLATLTPMITAYAVAKYDFKFSKVIYFIVIITMILPIVGAYPAELDLLMNLGLYDTIYGSWIQKTNFTTMYFLVFYATFKDLPKDYAEAAYIDGASEFRLMKEVMIPLAKNVFATIFLIMFVSLWNDYQAPALYIPSYPTLAYGVYYVSVRDNRGLFTYIPGHMTVCIIVALPIIALFIAFKDKLIGNLTMGGIKG